ncbi:MAG: hypothetical protein B9S34_06475 [Opitutia bacterium Tous-C1TDCM]|nr:MAG: hypothetical protein B9S34_06475 [Opitutae bacterium Tous-C1TDCM]
MKVPFPLSLKVSVWLLLNLLLLAAGGTALYLRQFGGGWDSLAVGALGDRLQSHGNALVAAYYGSTPEERSVVLAERDRATGAQHMFFLNTGQSLAGAAFELPADFARELRRGPPGRGGSFRGGAGGEGPPGRGPGPGRFLHRDADGTLWFGLRVPLLRDDGPPQRGTLVIRVPGLLPLFRLYDLLPWLGLGAAAFALSVLFWLPLVGSITRDLRRLTAATEALALGRFDTRVPDSGRDELGHLGRSVNRMAGRLDTLVNGQKRFLGDVAHELGSPLGRLQVATEILETRADPALREQVRDVREEVQQMAALVNELLAFTRAGLRPREAELAVVELAPLVAEVLAREDAAGTVRTELAAGAVHADRVLLGRALGNLVRNALRYAGPGATITLRSATEGPEVLLAVEDDGPGAPPEALDRLGEPFYRPETARTRETGGVGLGLAIVRSAAAACGGEVRFANRAPHGFRAELRLRAA